MFDKWMARKLWFVAVGTLLCASMTACMEKPAPPPPPPPPNIAAQIANAKRVFVSNLGSNDVAAENIPGGANACFNTFYASLEQWGHYQLVSSPKDADLVFEISATKRQWERTGLDVTSNHGAITFPAIITLSIDDPSKKSTLWTTQVAYLSTSQARKIELKQFNEAIEALTNRLKAMVPTTGPAPAP
ncbi:MAG: hypothetical protein WBY53_00425 [Acidobacteriaceae bacterium]